MATQENGRERQITFPEGSPPFHAVLQMKPVGRIGQFYNYWPTTLSRELGWHKSDVLGMWIGKRGGKSEVVLLTRLTQEEAAKLPNNGKSKRHTCDHASSLKGALFCVNCGARVGGKPSEAETSQT